jgi:hypothetical protein
MNSRNFARSFSQVEKRKKGAVRRGSIKFFDVLAARQSPSSDETRLNFPFRSPGMVFPGARRAPEKIGVERREKFVGLVPDGLCIASFRESLRAFARTRTEVANPRHGRSVTSATNSEEHGCGVVRIVNL